MSEQISYVASAYPVREDFAASHTRFWLRLGKPGNWWTAEQRIAIAAEVRQAKHCELCAVRKSALSPYAVDGEHDSATDLPDHAIEVIHRVTTDPDA